MSELARGRFDGQEIRVGDQVMLSAEVIRSVAGVGALVKLFSKTDEYQAWVAEEHLTYAVVDENLPSEPPDGTWLIARDSDNRRRIFSREDAESHNDPERRHDRHWFDALESEWIDWPAAVSRGAATTAARRMVVLGADQTEVDQTALDDAMHICWLHGSWEWLTRKMDLPAREAAADAVQRHHERIDPEDGPIETLRWWRE